VQRADVDHRHELQLGGQDIRNNFTLTEKGTNRSVGAQIQGQTRGRPPGTRVDFE
jgi:5-methylcytosine-specific restriction endonuclease McrA